MLTISDSIPDALKQVCQWVCFDKNKKPISATTGSPVAWQNNLACFEDAKAYAGQFELGLGFCFAGQTEFFGIDLDGCVNPKSGAIETWAMAIVELASSYTEVSMSGTGLKIICRSSLADNLKKIDFGDVKHGEHRQQAEFKTKSGYFALTGWLHPKLQREQLMNQLDPAQLHARIENYKRSLAYDVKTPPAISGQGGHAATVSVACNHVHGFGQTPNEAAILMTDWNQKCVPPWSESELQHKLDWANKREDSNGRQRGYLLNESKKSQSLLGVLEDELHEFQLANTTPSSHPESAESNYHPFPVDLFS